MRIFSYLLFIILFMACSTQKLPTVNYTDKQDYLQTERDRTILYNAYLSLAIEEPDSVSTQIQTIAKRYNGYTSSIGTSETVIRVESAYLEQAMKELSQLGKLENKSLSGQDVTEVYTDFQIRLDNAEKTRGRYLQLLDQATTVEEILKIEQELERLNEKIELLKGKINRIDHLAKYSTITIQLNPLQKPGILGYVGISIFRAVKWLFVRN